MKRDTNKLKITEIPIQRGTLNSEQKHHYKGLTDILLKHSTLLEDKRNDIGDDLRNMHLNDDQMVALDRAKDPNYMSLIESQVRYGTFEDSRMENLLASVKLPSLTFK